MRHPDSDDGRPVVSLRDEAGQLLAEYVYSPQHGRPILQKDFVYGLGQLLVERRRVDNPPVQTASSPMSATGGYSMTVTAGLGAPSYSADIRDGSGSSNLVTGIVPDAQGKYTIPESSLFPNTTNFVRIKKDGGEAEPYSAPVSIAYNPAITAQSPNTLRAISVSRLGNNLHLKWTLVADDGKRTRVYFDRADGTGLTPLTPVTLSSSILSLTFSSQALATQCGSIRVGRVDGGGNEVISDFGTKVPASGSSQDLQTGGGGASDCEPPDPPPGGGGPTPYTLADAFHHRDHLGSLRIVTDAGGHKQGDGVDYYPFGTTMSPDDGEGSRKRFTGHERDEATSLDYMLARVYGSGLGGFLSTDPRKFALESNPQSWNQYAYVLGNPMKLTDPRGTCPSTSPSPHVACGMSPPDPNPDSASSPEAKKPMMRRFLDWLLGSDSDDASQAESAADKRAALDAAGYGDMLSHEEVLNRAEEDIRDLEADLMEQVALGALPPALRAFRAMKVVDLGRRLPATLRRSASWHSELEEETLEGLEKIAGNKKSPLRQKAKDMLKLIKQSARLMEEQSGKPR